MRGLKWFALVVAVVMLWFAGNAWGADCPCCPDRLVLSIDVPTVVVEASAVAPRAVVVDGRAYRPFRAFPVARAYWRYTHRPRAVVVMPGH